jgi:iron(III) transport system permease protein
MTTKMENFSPQGSSTAIHWRGARIETILFPGVMILLSCAILFPLGFLVYGAFSVTPVGTPNEGYTLDNLVTVLSHPRYLQAIGHTLLTSGGSTLFASAVGISMAYLVTRTNVPGQRLIRMGVMVPFFVSPFVGALAWSLLAQKNVGLISIMMSAIGLPDINIYSVGGIIWVQGLYYAPYVFIFSTSALYNMDPSLEEAGHMSCLNRRQVMMRITIPLIAPAILSGMLLTFVSTAGQFGVPAVLGTPFNYYVITTYIYDLTMTYPSQFNMASSLSFVLFFIVAFCVWSQNRIIQGRSYATLSGKGFRPKVVDIGGWRWIAFGFALTFILLSAVLPLFIIGYVSMVTIYTAEYSWSFLTLDNYRALFFVNDMNLRAIKNTLILAPAAAILAVVLAVIINWITLRSRIRYKNIIDYLVMIPVSVPHVVLAIGMLWTYIYLPLPIYGTLWILLIGYITGFIPFAVRNVASTFMQIDKSLEEAATMVGASWLRTVREITLPLLKPGLVGAWMLLFIIYVRELTTSIFLYSPNSEVMAVMIYNRWIEGDYNALCAMAMIQIFFTGFVIFLVGYMFKIDISRSVSQ